MPALLLCLAALAFTRAAVASSLPYPGWCEVPARTQAGWVCGARMRTSAGVAYASFLAVPYAKQPLKELRFKELQPVEPWEGALNATAEGPVCPQKDVLYKSLMQRRGGVGEACIHASVHVPMRALPAPGACFSAAPLPILVFIHGGGFAFGSGDADMHGPDYFINKDTIVITFNYRLNVFGFLSLNSSEVPGNNGLRDVLTLLRWVRANARCFGGDPARVTLAGQSAGAVLAHLLTLVPAAEGLFHRVISLSGVATSDFFSSSEEFAATAAQLLLSLLGVDARDTAAAHAQLVAAPLDAIMRANDLLIDLFGLTTFVPVVESLHPGVTPMLLEDPETLIKRGVGKDIPLLLGFTNKECEVFRGRFREINFVDKIELKPTLIIPPRMTYTLESGRGPALAEALRRRYFSDAAPEDGLVHFCSDAYYKYPAIRVASQRVEVGGAPVSLYKFSYNGVDSALKEKLGLHFKGAAHIEDLTYLFRTSSYLGPASLGSDAARGDDDKVVDTMTDIVVKFMTSPDGLVAVGPELCYISVESPKPPQLRAPTARERDLVAFFDQVYANATTALD